ncbi:MAG TPA: SgcJ/EcaC family oxidoreductase [Gemmatimonadales bacterium]|nr:SgcJ/EcaC family oxidoreductase [Gemmatimonadales bacterium]
MIRLISACCLILLLLACASAPPAADGAADEAALRAVDSAWFTAVNAGDLDGVTALYAEHAVVSVPGAPPARGSEAVRGVLGKDIDNASKGGVKLVPGADAEVGVSGDLGWIWNTFTVTDKAGATVDAGKYLTLAERKDGKWRIIRDIWNSDHSPAPPATTATN